MSHPSKRPRHSGSFSPASPPYYNQSAQTKPSVQNPQTPVSPPTMAASTQLASSASGSLNTVTSDFTPATSATSASFIDKDEQGDAVMTDEPEDYHTADLPNGAEDRSLIQTRTDHDREAMEAEQRAQVRARLNQDMGQLWKFRQKTIPLSRPNLSQDVIALYNLGDIAAQVRRTDPTTGEKINKLRKSYEGKIKSLGIAGRNKAMNNPNQFWGQDANALLAMPEENWMSTEVIGKEIQLGLGDAFKKKLSAALQMGKGDLRGELAEPFRQIIGTDEPPMKAKVAMASKPPTLAPPTQAQPSRPASPMKPARPVRAGSKRGYDDSSFAGYSEGYGDDDESDNQMRKKQRKQGYPVSSPLSQQPTYGVGLVAGAVRR